MSLSIRVIVAMQLVPRSKIPKLKGMYIYNFIIQCQIFHHSCCTNLYSYQQYLRVLIFSIPLQFSVLTDISSFAYQIQGDISLSF